MEAVSGKLAGVDMPVSYLKSLTERITECRNSIQDYQRYIKIKADSLRGPTPEVPGQPECLPIPQYDGELGALESSIIELEIAGKCLWSEMQRLNF